jgi:hypothetical protein
MTRAELIALKKQAATRKEKATDMDVLITAMMDLPYGQAKKVLTGPVLEVLAKYGYTEDKA